MEENKPEKEDKKKRRLLWLLLLLLFIVILLMFYSVVYFANSNRKINDDIPRDNTNNNSNKDKNKNNNSNNGKNHNTTVWNVGFLPGTYKELEGKTFCGDLTANNSSISIGEINFKTEGLVCTYELTVRNTGDFNAKLGNITATSPELVSCTTQSSFMKCNGISYKLAKDQYGTETLETGEIIGKTNGILKVYLIIKSEKLSMKEDKQSNGGFTLFFAQE